MNNDTPTTASPADAITVHVTLDTSRLPKQRQGDFRARAQLNREEPEQMLARILRESIGSDADSAITVTAA